jgi:transposase-like protein
MTRRSKFSPEVRERAVLMVGSTGRLRFGVGGDDVDCREDRLHGRDLRRWCREEARRRAAPTALAADEGSVKLLEREVKELRRANEILRKASAYFAQAEPDRRER